MPAVINTKEKTIIPNNLAIEADEFDISAQPFLVVTLDRDGYSLSILRQIKLDRQR